MEQPLLLQLHKGVSTLVYTSLCSFNFLFTHIYHFNTKRSNEAIWGLSLCSGTLCKKPETELTAESIVRYRFSNMKETTVTDRHVVFENLSIETIN